MYLLLHLYTTMTYLRAPKTSYSRAMISALAFLSTLALWVAGIFAVNVSVDGGMVNNVFQKSSSLYELFSFRANNELSSGNRNRFVYYVSELGSWLDNLGSWLSNLISGMNNLSSGSSGLWLKAW
jgi:hypothetical protein